MIRLRTTPLRSLGANETARPGEINGSMFDRFSLAHAGAGAAYGLFGWGAPAALALGVGWEFAERPLKDHFPGAFPHASQDRLVNAVGDVLATMGGWWLARHLAG